jgi:serpin B
MKKFLTIIIIILLIAGGGLGAYYFLNKKPNTPSNPNKPVKPDKPKEYKDTGFTLNLIKTVNSSYNSNYLISPYSIEIALNMVKEGAAGNTLDEIETVVGTRDIGKVSSDVKIANAMFVKNEYKKDILDSFYNTIKSKYDAEIIYDEFKNPDVINDWADKKTDGMIKKVVDEISENFMLGLANAVAIDVNWLNKFDCDLTNSGEFTKVDGTKYNVEMMNQEYTSTAKYFELSDAQGVILPYDSSTGDNLEFVGILPKDDVSVFVESLTEEKLKSIDENAKVANQDTRLYVSLPRFTYSFDLTNFSDVLQTMGIKDAFDPVNANFSKISKIGTYISQAVHKSFIDLNENGTKAAAVTFFAFDIKSAIEPEHKTVGIRFDKPFVYMIRDIKTKEVLFFGVTYEPNEWNGTTCEQE